MKSKSLPQDLMSVCKGQWQEAGGRNIFNDLTSGVKTNAPSFWAHLQLLQLLQFHSLLNMAVLATTRTDRKKITSGKTRST